MYIVILINVSSVHGVIISKKNSKKVSGIITWYVMNSFLTCMHVHVCGLYQAAFFRDENGQSGIL